MLLFAQIMIWALLALTVFGVISLVRNERVYTYRQNLLNQIYVASMRDIWDYGDSPRDWNWRHEVYNSVSYNEMVFKFWRRLDSFYPDKSFIK